MTELDGADGAPVPMTLVAVTVNVYVVPLVNPVTVHAVSVLLQVKPLGEEVTVKSVIGAPPSLEGAVQAINAEPLPAVAITFVGAPGTVGPDVIVTWCVAEVNPAAEAVSVSVSTVFF